MAVLWFSRPFFKYRPTSTTSWCYK